MIDKQSKNISELHETIRGLNDDLGRKRESINTLEMEKFELEAKVQEQHKKIEQLSGEYDVLKVELANITEILESYYKKYPELELQFIQLKSLHEEILVQKRIVEENLVFSNAQLMETKGILSTTQEYLSKLN